MQALVEYARGYRSPLSYPPHLLSPLLYLSVRTNMLKGPKATEAKSLALSVLQTCLTVLQDVATDVGVPGLGSAVGGLSTIIDMIQATSANTERVKSLTEYVKNLTTVVANPLSQCHADVSPAMNDRIHRLISAFILVAKDMQVMKQRPLFKRFLGSKDGAGEIIGFMERIERSIRVFMIEGMFAIEFVSNDHARFSKESSQRIEAKLSEIHEAIQRLSIQSQRYRYATKAQYNSLHRTACLASTRTEILDQIGEWISARLHRSHHIPEDNTEIFWLNGFAGTGKTTIAYTVANVCQRWNILGASFFCSRDDAECSDSTLIFTTIAVQLASFCPEFQSHLLKVLSSGSQFPHDNVLRQLKELIVDPLAQVRGVFPPCVVVVDALDECKDPHSMSLILSALADYILQLYPLVFVIMSRPEHGISAQFRQRRLSHATDRLVLHDVPLENVSRDIKYYLEASFPRIKSTFMVPDGWPSPEAIEVLTERSAGLFIYAATAVRFIEDLRYSNPPGQLRRLLASTASSPTTLLDTLYNEILTAACPEPSPELINRLKTILGSIILIRSPLSMPNLEKLLGLEPCIVQYTLTSLRSVLSIPDGVDEAIRVIHPTFAEFLLRCDNPNFFIDQQTQHTLLLQCCLKVMTTNLRHDICGLRDPSRLNNEVTDVANRIARSVPPYLQYACLHWAAHLRVHQHLDDILLSLLDEFASKYLVFWVEVCSLLGRLDDAARTLHEVCPTLMSITPRVSEIVALMIDCERFIVMFFPSISASSLQIYYSALPFTPNQTKLRISYQDTLIPGGAVTVRREESKNWSQNLPIDSAHGEVSSLAFSPDGRSFVSGGDDSMVRIWTTDTHIPLATLSGHTNWVRPVTWSRDGNLIASGSRDNTVRIWDARVGTVVRILEGHTGSVWSVAFSPDGTTVVSGSGDHTVKMWKASVCQLTFKGHTDSVNSVAFSRDGKHIASGSTDGTVRLWDPLGIIPPRILMAHSDVVCSVVFSPDDTRLFSGGYEHALAIWDIDTGELTRRIETTGPIYVIAFSDDPSNVIFASGDAVYMMDITTGALLQTLIGRSVLAAAYSPDGTRILSSDENGLIQVWDTADDRSNSGPPESNASPHVSAAAFSSDGTRFALAYGTTLKIWDADTLTEVHSFESTHDGDDAVESLIFTRDSMRLLALSRSRACMWDLTTGAKTLDRALRNNALWWGMKGMKRMWESLIGCSPHTYNCHSGTFMLSYDETRLLSAAIKERDQHVVELWNVRTGEHVRTFTSHFGTSTPVAFSLDGFRIVSQLESRSIGIWDVETGALLHKCEGHEHLVCAVTFSPDGHLIASGSVDHTARVWDASTGEQLKVLKGHTIPVHSIAFSADGHCIFSGSWDDTIMVWDVDTGAPLHTFAFHGSEPWFRSLRFTSDGCEIIIGSENRAIRMWRGESAEANNPNLPPFERAALGRRTWPAYWMERDGWLFSFTLSQVRRLCWIPVEWRNWLASQGDMIVLRSINGAAVILDFAVLQTYLDSLESER
ncbi:Vegetative incompatibility protein HET-E-1 [Grifola frondosa]|uniref:Vegetative incompatibility protein HET-E-1 n=1 Tax=Grifola frondosa TaxID=5627 RepID=A0A1C7MGX2_GRIFR|nr:Vegetative incompatibility protein HET-E-1 [Grifola frondosa]